MEKKITSERNPVTIKTINDLAAALLAAAGKAAEGVVDVPQADTLCKCTDTLIKLARLQMEARGGNATGVTGVRWLEVDTMNDESLKNMKAEEMVLLNSLDNPEISDDDTKRLRAKLLRIQQAIANDRH
ncbi:MAG: hypothetical protein KGI06_05745 [Candidatus Micrarchaeota archaeon]|nr:hypothetical protein [Candidatus Micrarchaeota archaeon]